MNSTRLFAVILKELRQLRRDRLTFGMILGIPTLQLLLFGFAINLDIRHIDTAIVDQAQTVRLAGNHCRPRVPQASFACGAAVNTPEELNALLRKGKINIGIVLPRRSGAADRNA